MESKHDHAYLLFMKKNGQLFCPGCRDPSFGESYSCSNCGCSPRRCPLCNIISPGDSFYMCMHCWPKYPPFHYSCVKFSNEHLNITCHPHGSLFYEELTSGSYKMECDFCYLTHYDYKFCCKVCDFKIGFPCALKFVKYHEGREHVQHFSHRHPLTLFQVDDMTLLEVIDMNCKLCYKKIEGPIYGCAPCEFFIHSSCREWPQEIRHPFHPAHKLTLDIGEQGEYTCKACCFDFQGFRYRCKKCEFYLHPECTSLKPNTNYEGHQHLVILIENLSYESKCGACGFDIEGDFFVRCMECCFDFHVQCGSQPLPPTVLHEQHKLALSLSTDQTLAKDDSRLVSCSSCRKTVNMDDPFYYCTGCEYVAHVRCALTNIQGDEKEKLRHFSHEHVLIFDEIQKDVDILCKGCRRGIQGPAYGCVPCIFYLHKSCAELPRNIYHHYHGHYLSLQFSNVSAHGMCDSCHKHLNGFVYNCDSCNFNLDFECASLHPSIDLIVSTKQCKNLESQEKIGHFSHQDPLSILEVDGVDCKLCYKKINGSCYGCAPCKFYIHKSCSELLQEIQHPLHPRHSLKLEDIGRQRYVYCDACYIYIQGLTYRCIECGFDLHPECTSLKPNIKYEGHEHLLTLVENMSRISDCEDCPLQIQGAFFLSCVECRLKFHVQCGPLQLPSVVVQKQHKHPLDLIRDDTLVKDDSDLHCHVCKEEITNPKHRVYYCAECQDYAHMRCVITEVQRDEREKLLHFSHQHFLFLFGNDENDVSFGNKKNDDVTCCACEKLIQVEPAYGCHPCKFYLHKSCADLPRELQHPFHRHPLTLPEPYSEVIHECNACCKNYKSFTYACQQCNFNLDLGCSLLQPSVKLDTHQHTLTFFKKLHDNLQCDSCQLTIPADKSNPIDSYCIRCVICNYNLHLSCRGLPETIQHYSHQHSLILKDNFVDLGFECDGGYYCCDVCETRRYPGECVYFCEECSYVVDIDCVMPEVIQFLEGKLEDVEWRVVNRGITQKEIIDKKGLSFKDIVTSLSDQETKTIEATLYNLYEELKEINDLDNVRISRSLARIDEDYLQSTAKYYVQGTMQLESIGKDAEAELVNVRGYKINRKLVPILRNLLDKHGDIGQKCPWNQRLKTIPLVTFCAIVQEMSNTQVMDIDYQRILRWWFFLNLCGRAGFRIDFALDHVKRIAEANFLINKKTSQSSPLFKFHEEMAQHSKEIDERKAKVEELRKRADDKISSHSTEKLKSEAKRLNEVLGLWWKNAGTGLL